MRSLLFIAILPGLVLATAITWVDNLGSLGSGESVAYGINVLGMAVGWSTNSYGTTNAFSANGPAHCSIFPPWLPARRAMLTA